MSKVDSLLKKAEVYERLALYSDRRSFLRALAQNMTPAHPVSFPGDLEQQNSINPPAPAQALDASTRALLQQAQSILQSKGVETNAIGNALLFNKVDWNAIRREIQNSWLLGKLSPLADGPQIQQLQSILANLGRSTSGPPAPNQVATQTHPQQRQQATMPQIANQLIQRAKNLWAQGANQQGDARNKTLGQINAILGQLLSIRKQLAKSKDLQAAMSIAGISYLFKDLYSDMSYDDLMVVKNFEFGRSVGFNETTSSDQAVAQTPPNEINPYT